MCKRKRIQSQGIQIAKHKTNEKNAWIQWQPVQQIQGWIRLEVKKHHSILIFGTAVIAIQQSGKSKSAYSAQTLYFLAVLTFYIPEFIQTHWKERQRSEREKKQSRKINEQSHRCNMCKCVCVRVCLARICARFRAEKQHKQQSRWTELRSTHKYTTWNERCNSITNGDHPCCADLLFFEKGVLKSKSRLHVEP